MPFDDITKAIPTTFPRCLESVLQVPLGNWTVLRLGEGQCDVTESCVERMTAGEECEVSLKKKKKNLAWDKLEMAVGYFFQPKCHDHSVTFISQTRVF